ncbi:MAG: histidine kinase [Bacteroidota bacterium]|nr:histidine kinase [Bacteroidota bacterium]
MSKIKCIIFLLVSMFMHFLSSAQVSQEHHLKRRIVNTINFEQGLLNNATTDIVTDALGFTWVSTQTGMQRYNGYVLEKINPVIDKDTININSPVYFFTMKNGSIWISWKSGIIAYDPFTNSFKKILSQPNPDNIRFLIVPVKETNEGVWCLHKKKGVVLYTNQGIIKPIPFPDRNYIDAIFMQPDILINTIFATNEHYIFVYNGKDEIVRLNLQTRKYNIIKTGIISGLACDQQNLYVITKTSLKSLNIQNGKPGKIFILKNIFNEQVAYSNIFLKDSNELLIGINRHLYQFDTSFSIANEITNLNRNPVLSVGLIRIIYSDKYKRIWLLTNDDIKRIQNVTIPFEHLIYANERNNFVRSIYYDSGKNILLAGCFNGGIQLYDTTGNPLWQKALTSDMIRDVLDIEKLTMDDYLVMTLGKGWFILNLPSKRVRKFKLSGAFENILHTHLSNFSNNIKRIDDSVVFLTTSINVFRCVFHHTVLQSAQPLLPFESNTSNRINCFIYTSDKTLWVGTVAGNVFRIDKNKVLPAIHIPGNYLIRSFAEDALHNIWTGTDKGLFVYNSAGQLIKKITVESGLLNDCIYAMLPVDNTSSMYASTNLGLSYISLNGSIINYTKESGLQENEFNTQAAAKTKAGKYYFGGINGITSFYPSNLSEVTDSPALNITHLIVNDSLYNFSTGIWRGDSIILDYSQNHLQLDVAALGLFNASQYDYHYRLKGFEENWQQTHQPTGIKYVLQPGSYLFEINCAPIFSANNIISKTITIIISPPWWRTWWFRILIIAFSVAVIALVVRQYLSRQYKKRLDALQLQHEIQKERERISRDLHDNLGAYAAAIASNVSSMKISENGINATMLRHLKSNSQSIITQLNDTIWALNKEAISLTAVSDRFKVFLQKIQPSHPGIPVSIEEKISIDQQLSPASALHLFRIMQEAINNALRHSEASQVIILIEAGEQWKVSIEDNGRGIERTTKNTDGGNGIINMQTRAQQAGWQIVWRLNALRGTSVIISSTTN